MKNYSLQVLLDKLRSVDWMVVLNEEDVNHAWTKFSTLILEVIDDIAPV